MKKLFNLLLLLIPVFGYTQQTSAPCGAITERVPIPAEYSTNAPLPPDPCDALADYGTEKSPTISATPEYLEIEKRIRVVVETLIDPDNCSTQVREISRDTIVVGQRKVYVASTEPTSEYWTVRMELMVYPPNSRPDGCLVTKLPDGAMAQDNTQEIKDYWVVHYGQYRSKAEAKAATTLLKQRHPEFCRAYAYLLPAGCQYQFQYIANQQ
jgi:hypothetical protein